MLRNYIDIIIILYLLFFVVSETKKKPKEILSELFSIAAAIVAALFTYSITADFITSELNIPQTYSKVIGFFLNIALIKAVLLFLFDYIFKKTNFSLVVNAKVQKISSVVLSFIYGMFKVFILISIIISLALPAFIKNELAESKFVLFVSQDPAKINSRLDSIFKGFLQTAVRDFDFMNIKTGTNERYDLNFETLDVKIDSQAEQEMLELVNKERTSRGLKPLAMDEEARKAARDYGKYLFENGVFSHIDLEGRSPSERMKNYNVTFMLLGENLAYAPSLEQAHQGLMESEGHRENILHPFFSRVGIGVVDGGSYGIVFVQEFMD